MASVEVKSAPVTTHDRDVKTQQQERLYGKSNLSHKGFLQNYGNDFQCDCSFVHVNAENSPCFWYQDVTQDACYKEEYMSVCDIIDDRIKSPEARLSLPVIITPSGRNSFSACEYITANSGVRWVSVIPLTPDRLLININI